VSDVISGKYRGACNLGSYTSAQTARGVLEHLRLRQKKSRLSWVASKEEETRHKAAVFSGAKPYLLVDMGAQARAFRQALAELSQDIALTLVLFEVTRHDLQEIALLLGVTPSVAQDRLVQGRRELASALRRALGVSGA
jgi:DNA-directed RNA polymerase specialized sigma24 family protein